MNDILHLLKYYFKIIIIIINSNSKFFSNAYANLYMCIPIITIIQSSFEHLHCLEINAEEGLQDQQPTIFFLYVTFASHSHLMQSWHFQLASNL